MSTSKNTIPEKEKHSKMAQNMIQLDMIITFYIFNFYTEFELLNQNSPYKVIQ